MKNHNKKQNKRVRNLIFMFTLTAIVISVATYAWFVGMRTVNVTSFEVKIAATDSLALSLDGKRWDTTISISADTLDEKSYPNHTNTWGGKGLIPISTVGDMDVAVSRPKLFEKSSLTATRGGYRLISKRIDNHSEPTEVEPSGYVAFDLFISNTSGEDYFPVLNFWEEEAIYLTVNSEVQVLLAGAEGTDGREIGVQGTGIENSVRVAFAQIGRVIRTTTDENVITSITCNDDGSGNPTVVGGVTGICRKAQIWEPNDRSHVQGAISWYNKSCRERTKLNITEEESYGEQNSCGVITNGLPYPTYAINSEILASNHVDIYDGAAYNKYTTTTLLTDFPYFTDTMKLQAGTERPEFMRLAPNSITKVRVYIYIEGQDIDNYDFAAVGKSIAVNFGFTKERLTEDDIDYEGEDINQGLGPNGEDLTAPIITLNGSAIVEVDKDALYEDLGATATDNIDETVTVAVTNQVNTAVPGTYTVIYRAVDAAGNVATKVRTVIVKP